MPPWLTPARIHAMCSRTKSATLLVSRTQFCATANRSCSSSVCFDMPASDVVSTDHPRERRARIRASDCVSSSRYSFSVVTLHRVEVLIDRHPRFPRAEPAQFPPGLRASVPKPHRPAGGRENSGGQVSPPANSRGESIAPRDAPGRASQRGTGVLRKHLGFAQSRIRYSPADVIIQRLATQSTPERPQINAHFTHWLVTVRSDS